MKKGRVYPRLCGGTGRRCNGRHRCWGLSPPVRGNLLAVRCPRRRPRSIPACAGEPINIGATPTQAAVYPRLCGGTQHRLCRQSAGDGLSPPVRGNRRDNVCGAGGGGSIPACAGEPKYLASRGMIRGVYPRLCGGNHMRRRIRRPQGRSIPACAGEPPKRKGRAVVREVYPRLCGGTRVVAISDRPVNGLSPPVRGNRNNAPRWLAVRRSIPACAGEPSRMCRRSAPPTVYPRLCG